MKMKKQEFENNDKPLVLILSWHSSSDNTMSEYYDFDEADDFLKQYEQDFPEYFHFMRRNKAAIEANRKLFGL